MNSEQDRIDTAEPENREVFINEDQNIEIQTDWRQEMDHETFMNLFENKVQNYVQHDRKVDQVKHNVKAAINNHGPIFKDLYEVDAEHDFEHINELLEEVEIEEPVTANNVVEGATKYVESVKNMERLEEIKDTRDELQSEVESLWDTAVELVENEGFDMPSSVQILEFIDSSEFFPEDEVEQ